VIRHGFPECLNYRPALFKFTETGTMKPGDLFLIMITGKCILYFSDKAFPALNPKSRLLVEQGCNPDSKNKERNENVVKEEQDKKSLNETLLIHYL
jgi:hypothetical protein